MLFFFAPAFPSGSVERTPLPPTERQSQGGEAETPVTQNRSQRPRGGQTVQQDVVRPRLPPPIQTLLLHSRGPEKSG